MSAYVRYDDLGEVSTVDVNLTRLTDLPRPEYWNNPLRQGGPQETVHLAGIFPSKETTKIILTEKNTYPLRWFTACDFNTNGISKPYWRACHCGGNCSTDKSDRTRPLFSE